MILLVMVSEHKFGPIFFSKTKRALMIKPPRRVIVLYSFVKKIQKTSKMKSVKLYLKKAKPFAKAKYT